MIVRIADEGGAPVIAKAAKEEGATAIGIVTLPFRVEDRDDLAERGLKDLYEHADSAIIIDNNELHWGEPDLPVRFTFEICEKVFSRIIQSITETIMKFSSIKLDFADIRTIMGATGVYRFDPKGEDKPERIIEETINSEYVKDESDDRVGRGLYV